MVITRPRVLDHHKDEFGYQERDIHPSIPLFQVYIAVMQGDALRLVYGYSFVRPSVCPSVCQFVHSFIHPSIFPCIPGRLRLVYGYDLFVRLSIRPSVCPFVRLLVRLFIHSFNRPFIHSFNLFQVYIAVYSVMQGDALRLVYGYDSFGNTCNRGNNAKIKTNLTDVPLSGQDTTGKTYVFIGHVE